jgi:hypothetical protein
MQNDCGTTKRPASSKVEQPPRKRQVSGSNPERASTLSPDVESHAYVHRTKAGRYKKHGL